VVAYTTLDAGRCLRQPGGRALAARPTGGRLPLGSTRTIL